MNVIRLVVRLWNVLVFFGMLEIYGVGEEADNFLANYSPIGQRM